MNRDLSRDERIDHLDEANQGQWDFGQWIVSLAEGAGTYLTHIVGDEAASAGLREMFSPVAVATGFDGKHLTWREILERAMPDVYHLWPIAGQLNEVAGYAVYGILLRGDVPAKGRQEYISDMVAKAQSFLDASPLAAWKITERPAEVHLTRIIKLAANRLALDTGGAVEPQALAEFGGLSEGRIRNMMSGSDRKFSNENGKIPASDALAWLRERDDFFDSIWRDDEPFPEPTIASASEILFLPVGRDGTPFHPGLARSGRYTVGLKGAEQQVPDFWQALDILQHMDAPSWRRPNELGNWGIIRAVEWKRFTRKELENLQNNPNYRVPTRDRATD